MTYIYVQGTKENHKTLQIAVLLKKYFCGTITVLSFCGTVYKESLLMKAKWPKRSNKQFKTVTSQLSWISTIILLYVYTRLQKRCTTCSIHLYKYLMRYKMFNMVKYNCT